MVDFLSRSARRALMSRIKGKDTEPEKRLRSLLRRAGSSFRTNVASLPGKPDIVFFRMRVVVFVDGDFWHGYRYIRWKRKVTPYWRDKIETNMRRDRRNFARLRRCGWTVVRVWGHELRNKQTGIPRRLLKLLRLRRVGRAR
ncbi:MAG: very short patch repair endonuclease [Planctomycetota bacterium]|nr:very short patch repair endonuclease [Planctomycetota bacterium]